MADSKELQLWALDRNDGTVLWKGLLGDGNEKVNKQNMSSPSPVTDGTSVWVMTGTGVLKHFDFDGNEIWGRNFVKDYGKFGQMYGYGLSPLLHGDAVYVQVIHGKEASEPSYLLSIDKATGETRWRVERHTKAVGAAGDSYGSPAVLKLADGVEIIVSGANVVTGCESTTGLELWRADGLNPENNPTSRSVASPVVTEGIVYAPARFGPMLAIQGGGRGDVTESHRLWAFGHGPEVPTPVRFRKMRSSQTMGVDALKEGSSSFPSDVLLSAPLRRKLHLEARAVEKRPTPLRPVVRMGACAGTGPGDERYENHPVQTC